MEFRLKIILLKDMQLMQPKIGGKYYLNQTLLVEVLVLEETKISFLLLSLHQEDIHAKAILYHD